MHSNVGTVLIKNINLCLLLKCMLLAPKLFWINHGTWILLLLITSLLTWVIWIFTIKTTLVKIIFWSVIEKVYVFIMLALLFSFLFPNYFFKIIFSMFLIKERTYSLCINSLRITKFILSFTHHYFVLRINSREPTCSKAIVIKASITYTIFQSSQAILKTSSTLRLLLISGITTLAIIICILFIAFYPKFIRYFF